MVNALLWMITLLIRPMVNHDISYQVVMIHWATMLDEHLTLRECRASVKVFSGIDF